MFKRTEVSTALAIAFGGTLAVMAMPSLAQQADQKLERVEITGSSIKRIEAETALPVTVVTKDEIQKSGATTAAELLDKLSVNNGNGYNQNLALGDSARPGFAGASLRGLGSNTTLVLLNGRRLAVYALDGGAVDLNSIALGAIERVEILRDGASAIYGTDAVAGVINFITRKDYRGVDISVGARSPQDVGGKSKNLSITGGIGDLGKDRFNVFGNITYDKSDALKASERNFSRTAFLPNAPGGVFDRTSGNTIPASITVPGVGTLSPGVPNCLPPFSFQTSPNGACRFDYAATIDILAPQEKTGVLLRGTLQLTSDLELYSEINKTRTEAIFRISPTPASAATTFNGDPVLYPAGGQYYPQAINPATGQLENGVLRYNGAGVLVFQPLSGDLDINWRTLDAGPRTNKSVADQDRLVLGGKGALGNGWDFDAAFMRSASKATESYVEGLLSESRLLNSTGGLPTDPGYTPGTLNPIINPFGRNDAAGLAALREAQITGPVRISKSTRTSVDGKVSGEITQLPAGPLGVAVGVERRKEVLNDNPLPVLNSGDVIGGGGNQLPVNASRTVSAIFGEAAIPLMKSLEATAQFRYDKYSDFGSTTNPKLGLRWQPTAELLFRGSVGTGFRAPTLPDIFQPQTQTNTGGSYNDPYYEAKVGDCYENDPNNPGGRRPTANFNVAHCSAQLDVLQGGNPNLKPEESRQRSFGLVVQPNKDLSFSFDLWKIKISGQIATPDADELMSDFLGGLLQNSAGAYDPTTATLSAQARTALVANLTGKGISVDPTTGFFNAVQTLLDNINEIETHGVDVGVDAVIARTEYGIFRGKFDGTYLTSQKQDGVELVGQYGQFGPITRWRHTTRGEWSMGGWSAELAYRWQSSYGDKGGTRRVSAYEIFDLSLGYSGIKDLRVRFGVQNLLDRDPPYTRQNDYFQVGYDPTYVDPRGRTFTVGATYSFK